MLASWRSCCRRAHTQSGCTAAAAGLAAGAHLVGQVQRLEHHAQVHHRAALHAQRAAHQRRDADQLRRVLRRQLRHGRFGLGPPAGGRHLARRSGRSTGRCRLRRAAATACVAGAGRRRREGGDARRRLRRWPRWGCCRGCGCLRSRRCRRRGAGWRACHCPRRARRAAWATWLVGGRRLADRLANHLEQAVRHVRQRRGAPLKQQVGATQSDAQHAQAEGVARHTCMRDKLPTAPMSVRTSLVRALPPRHQSCAQRR